MHHPARLALLAILGASSGGPLAQAPPPGGAPRPAPSPAGRPAAPDPAFEAAKAGFEAMPEAERRAVQDALVWTGDYNGVTTGAFGRRSFEGVATYQKRTGAVPTGLLSDPEKGALLRAGEAARTAAGFRVRIDPASGAAIGVPERVLSKRSAIPGGTRWQSADGRVTLDTKAFAPGETDLDALFERASAVSPERRVTYKLRKPDFVVVTGETPAGRFYIRYAAGPAGIRGFTLGYDKARAGEVDRLVIAVANSFAPFPDAAPESAAAPPPTSVRPTPPPLPALAAAPSATGFVVAAGRVLASASALEGCAEPRIAGAPARTGARDASGGLLLLEAERAPAPRTVAPPVRAEAPEAGESLAVLGAVAEGPPGLAVGTAEGGFILAPLQPGAGGAPVLDRSGRLAGLVARFPREPRLIAGVMPPTRYAMMSGTSIAAFLSANGIALAPPAAGAVRTLGEAMAPSLSRVVAIDCPAPPGRRP